MKPSSRIRPFEVESFFDSLFFFTRPALASITRILHCGGILLYDSCPMSTEFDALSVEVNVIV